MSDEQQQQKARRKTWTPVFLECLRDTANVRLACTRAGVSREAAYRLRERDPAFAAAWQDALDDACDLLEARAREWATIGVEEEVWHQGQIAGKTRKADSAMLRFLLQAHRPELYGKQRLEHSGPEGAPIRVEGTVDLSKLTGDELAHLRALVARCEE